MGEKAKVTLYRYDPETDTSPHLETYDVPYEYWHGVKVIDTLRYLYENNSPDLCFREPCRQQVCGGCAVLVNKKPVLACGALSEQEMVIEPLSGQKVIKDLVVAFKESGDDRMD